MLRAISPDGTISGNEEGDLDPLYVDGSAT
jgi:hypothetical protein